MSDGTTPSAWYKEQKDVIEQKVHAANADGHKFQFLTLNVWFAAGSWWGVPYVTDVVFSERVI